MRAYPHPEGVVINPQRPWGPQDVKGYSEEVVNAMKMLEPLLQAGLLALVPDQWTGGKLTFLTPSRAARQGWKPPQADQGQKHAIDVQQG